MVCCNGDTALMTGAGKSTGRLKGITVSAGEMSIYP